jgi:FMN phosphatase YigB (HAD superfamily)
MINVSIDLDNTLFDMEPLYKMAFRETGFPYTPATKWDLYKVYPTRVADRLVELFKSEHLYKNPLLDEKIPVVVNRVYNSKMFKVHYVTERFVKNPEKTFNQLKSAGLPCAREDVFDMPAPKVEVLKSIDSHVHFDDSPNIISDCIKHGVRCVMISNDKTLYNHELRGHVIWFPNIMTALNQMCPVK